MQSNSTPHKHNAKNGTLYIVATPIGNLQDITLRALDILKTATTIYCEDTRHTLKLLQAHNITTPTQAYHEHNAAKVRPKMLDQLASGQSIALVSDAGTPLISDPGYKLVEEARTQNIPVTPLPGACAAITALCAAGLPTDQFHFVGFLPNKSSARTQALKQFAAIPGTLVFYESPRRLLATLQDALSVLGNRPATVARELTKTYEEFRTDTLQSLITQYEQAEATIKGEIVLLIAPATAQDNELTDEAIEAQLQQAMQDFPVKEAAAMVAANTGRKKRDLYQWALRLKSTS